MLFRSVVRALDLDRNNRIMAIANCLWGAGSGIYLPIWPIHLERLGASPTVLGVLLGLAGVIGIVISIPAASLATRLGLKRALLVGWGLAPFGTAIFAVASTWEAVVPGIIALALVGLCGPAYSSYIGVAAGGRDLPRTFTLMGASITLGTVLTAPVGGAIADAFGMTPVLIGATILYFLSFASTWRLDDLRIGGRLGRVVAVGVPLAELAVAGLLLMPATARVGAASAFVLLCGFSAVVAAALRSATALRKKASAPSGPSTPKPAKRLRFHPKSCLSGKPVRSSNNGSILHSKP